MGKNLRMLNSRIRVLNSSKFISKKRRSSNNTKYRKSNKRQT